ncbi:hypothetical protein ACFPN9_20475, partial [Bosea massiliensis]
KAPALRQPEADHQADIAPNPSERQKSEGSCGCPGQRTTLDVLNAQQELVIARSSLVTAQRDRVVASYTALSAIGRLSAETLGLKAEIYNSRRHYDQVKGLLWGTQTPDGR